MQMPALPNFDMSQAGGAAKRAAGWLQRTVTSLCSRPDHLQRLAIIGAGMVMYPTLLGLIFIVWRGYDPTAELQSQSLNIMGFALYGAMALFGLVVVALLGIVKGIRVDGPGGFGVELTTTADDPDAAPGDDHPRRDRHSQVSD